MNENIKNILDTKGINNLQYKGQNEYVNGYYVIVITKTSIIIRHKIGYCIPEIIDIA